MSDNSEITIVDIPVTPENMQSEEKPTQQPVAEESNPEEPPVSTESKPKEPPVAEESNKQEEPTVAEESNKQEEAVVAEETTNNTKMDNGAGVISAEMVGQIEVVEDEMDKIVDEGLAAMVSRYLEDDVIDNEELLDLVQYAIELAERKRNLSGVEKKQVAMTILKKFMEKKVNNWNELEKLISKAIDFAVDVSRNGINKIKLTSNTISESKTAFNLIYSSAMSQINLKYPLADDIINNLFDIAKHIMEIMEGQTSLTNNEKKVLLKKILNKVISSLSSKLNQEQKTTALSQIEPTVALIMIGLRAKDGEISINPEEVMTLMQCLCRCFKKSNKKK